MKAIQEIVHPHNKLEDVSDLFRAIKKVCIDLETESFDHVEATVCILKIVEHFYSKKAAKEMTTNLAIHLDSYEALPSIEVLAQTLKEQFEHSCATGGTRNRR
ncbi:hypothetical protein [Paenibacillus larvae]|uniref:Uncharacterized protein n=1 Tax=Paenibacillus larvae subsp. larvae TaxID=147375 RepID=A0A2L1U3X2_9BACL|nr:hypothetical protein [Paenibacillus larvae]AQZ45598.1 hypothetical protein B5S25_02275 [Paenibacillus larvae subsp. pulvifaciens]AVF27604.1 hypothetical protein ERICIII_03494 [Paenibacillus larvae subsp. larvae]MBH0344660.1 hypothetical protein [Paenibacillus larvae]MCY7520652.1 hypothetical protein [Paenibacillus larvae]MCY9501279.1 hypothetical protein [Paenibacillus larvae]